MTTVQVPATNTKSPFADMKGSHVAPRVPDFEASKTWFVENLDFRVIHEWPVGELNWRIWRRRMTTTSGSKSWAAASSGRRRTTRTSTRVCATPAITTSAST